MENAKKAASAANRAYQSLRRLYENNATLIAKGKSAITSSCNFRNPELVNAAQEVEAVGLHELNRLMDLAREARQRFDSAVASSELVQDTTDVLKVSYLHTYLAVVFTQDFSCLLGLEFC